jgi:ubiquinol-cytochrome c reductase cytochrome c1 subunit
MIRKLSLSAAIALAGLAGGAMAQEHGAAHIEDIAFSFEGPFGKFDEHQLQRGFQVFNEVCSACHGLKYVPIRTLSDDGGPHMPEDQIRAFAATLTVVDHETGEERPALPSDHFPANTGAGAPDLSLMAKARAAFHGPAGLGLTQLFRGIGGPEYIHAILTGYTGEDKEEAGSTFYENHAFSTGWIKMPAPLQDGQVTFADGSPNDVEHMSRDVASFLMWAAEPKLMARKQAGFVAVLFLGLFAVLLYLTNKRIWAPLKGKQIGRAHV